MNRVGVQSADAPGGDGKRRGIADGVNTLTRR